MYSTLGSMLATAFIKLNPIHRRLTELEIANIRDFFNSDFIRPERRRSIGRISAFFMTYLHAICRTTKISKQARQDYYALQRQGCFVAKELSDLPKAPLVATTQPPLLIIPGLNTPPVFFREMYSYFTEKGYHVSIMNLPSNGLADIASSAAALKEEIERIKTQSGASRVNIIGHCLGGLVAHYWLECAESAQQISTVKHLITLGTGFLGAEGVQQLKNLWIPRNPGKPVPKVFDELIQANMNMIRRSHGVIRHNLLTVWDFMVHFRNGLQQSDDEDIAQLAHHIIEDPAIDHLTIALNHSVFHKMDAILSGNLGLDSGLPASLR
jgi:hypothetical protein